MSNERSSDRLPPDPLGTRRLDTTLPGLKPAPPLTSFDLLRPPGTPATPGTTPRLSDLMRPADGTGTLRPPGDTTLRPADTRLTPASDRVLRNPNAQGVVEVTYGEADFDAIVRQKNYSTLRIKGVPEGVEPRSWVDERGGYYFWWKNGADGRAPHYFGSNVQTLIVDRTVGRDGRQLNPIVKPADELRISASQAYLAEQNRVGFASYNNATDAFTYFQRMSTIAARSLEFQERALKEGAQASPNNPYFRIYLADVMTAQAVKPIVDAITSGQALNNDQREALRRQALAKIDAAGAELVKAQDLAAKNGYRHPNREMQPPLHPFGLNPDFRNPDFYWSGAAYQAYQREVQLILVRALIANTDLTRFQKLGDLLPPALPPRR